MNRDALLGRLLDHAVDFVIIGGTAANMHGVARVTYDLDVVYERSSENVRRLVAALSPIHPYLRGARAGLPFRFDEETVSRGLNFTLTTDGGDLDLLGEVTGVGDYAAARARSLEGTISGSRIRFLDLGALIEAKRAAGRPKDFEAIAELEVLLAERRSPS